MKVSNQPAAPGASPAAHARRTNSATAALVRANTPAEVAQAALAHAMPALGAEAGALAVLSPDGAELEIVANRGFSGELCESWRSFPGDRPHPVSEAVRQSESVWLPSSEAYYARFPEPLPGGQAFNAWAVVPLRIDGGGLGVLALGFHAPRAFADEDRDFLRVVAVQSAQALARARLYEATARAAERLARLQTLTGTLSQAASAVQVAETIVAHVSSGLGAAACAVLMLSPDGSALALLAGSGLSPETEAVLQRLPLSAAHPAADVLQSGAPVWLPSHAALLALYPHLAELHARTSYEALAAIPLAVRGSPLGVLLFSDLTPRTFPPEDRAFILALAHQCAQALDRARLYTDLEARVRERTAALEREVAERRRVEEQLRGFSVYLEQSLEDERTRIARQAHDELGSGLTGIKIELKRLQAELPAERLDELLAYVDGLVKVVRQISSDLRPAVLDDLGLVAALEWQMEEFQRRSGLQCRLELGVEEARVAPVVGTAVFRIVKEGLTNILRHADATTVTLTLDEDGESLVVTLRDDGRGIAAGRPAPRESLGLMGMHERAKLVGGQLEIGGGPGQGTVVHIRVPLQAE